MIASAVTIAAWAMSKSSPFPVQTKCLFPIRRTSLVFLQDFIMAFIKVKVTCRCYNGRTVYGNHMKLCCCHLIIPPRIVPFPIFNVNLRVLPRVESECSLAFLFSPRDVIKFKKKATNMNDPVGQPRVAGRILDELLQLFTQISGFDEILLS